MLWESTLVLFDQVPLPPPCPVLIVPLWSPVTMDSWTEKQIKMMSMGGNAQCNSFLSQYGVSSATHSIAQKYNSPPAQLYRERSVASCRPCLSLIRPFLLSQTSGDGRGAAAPN